MPCLLFPLTSAIAAQDPRRWYCQLKAPSIRGGFVPSRDAQGPAMGMETGYPLRAREQIPIRGGLGRGGGSLQWSTVDLRNPLYKNSSMQQKSLSHTYVLTPVGQTPSILTPSSPQLPQPPSRCTYAPGSCWGPGNPPLMLPLSRCLAIH